MMKYLCYVLVLGVTVFLGVVNYTQAASLYLDPAYSSLNRGDAIKVAVRLDTDEAQGECVNAVDAVIRYSENIEPVDISTGNSIFSIWVESPKINKEERTVTFAGGVPNGYCGRVIGDPKLSNIITEIIFRSPGFIVGAPATDENKATIDFIKENSVVYLNDGQGTSFSPAVYGASIDLSNSLGSAISNPWRDEVNSDSQPPTEFAISLQKDDTAFARKWFIVFNSNDKQTGIDHYEVMEEPISQFGTFRWGEAVAPWTIERSPYVLKDQTLNSIIRVKAVDKSGNEYISTLIPDDANRTLSFSFVLVVVVFAALLLLIISILFVAIRRAWKKAKTNQTEAVSEKDSESENYE